MLTPKSLIVDEVAGWLPSAIFKSDKNDLPKAKRTFVREIADSLGLKAGSVKLLLFRARRRLADLLRGPRIERERSRP